MIPLKLIGTPDDVAAAAIFLGSDQESRLATGSTICLDGGQTIA